MTLLTTLTSRNEPIWMEAFFFVQCRQQPGHGLRSLHIEVGLRLPERAGFERVSELDGSFFKTRGTWPGLDQEFAKPGPLHAGELLNDFKAEGIKYAFQGALDSLVLMTARKVQVNLRPARVTGPR